MTYTGFGVATAADGSTVTQADYDKAYKAGVAQNDPFVLGPGMTCPGGWLQERNFTTGADGKVVWEQTWCKPQAKSSSMIKIVGGVAVGLFVVMLLRKRG